MTCTITSKSLRPSKKQTPTVSRRAAPLTFVALLLVVGLAATDAAAQGGTGNVIHIYSESFDNVTAPALPAGWTTTTTGGGLPFTTVAGSTETAPNALRVTMPAAEGTSTLLSPPILINQPGAVVTFRHRFNTELGWDGGRVDIIPDPGGSYLGTQFLANGYNSKFRGALNQLENLALPDVLAWSGNSDGYIETKFALPNVSSNYSIRIQFTAAHDGTFAEEGEWLIDSLSVTGEFTATNAGLITIPSSGTASPYPSEIEVSGMIGAVTQVVVRLHNFSHSSPDDVDVMLVAPNGRKLILMSDAGGNHSVNNVTLTFADSATDYLPDEGVISEGVYKPTDYEAGDSFPSPAPSGGTLGTTLSSFFGGVANGTYKLFVVDDNGNNVGSVGGWSIALRTSSNICQLTFSPVVAFPAAGGSGTMHVTTQAGCSWSLVSYSTNVIDLGINDRIEGVGSGSFSYTVLENPSVTPRTGSFNFRSATQITGTHIQQHGQPQP